MFYLDDGTLGSERIKVIQGLLTIEELAGLVSHWLDRLKTELMISSDPTTIEG